MRFIVLGVAAVLFACGPAAYRSRGVLRANDVEERSLRTAGCLDVVFGLRPPLEPSDDALLVVRFGNRCLRPVPFDLASASLYGHDADGTRHTLRFVDPRGEIEPLHLDAGVEGVEKLRVAGAESALRELCIELSRVAPGSQPVCFRAKGAHGWEVAS